MIEGYLLRTDSIDDPLLHPEWEAYMEPARREQIRRMQDADSRRISAAAGLLLFHVMKMRGVDSFPEGVYRDSSGKPGHPQLHFNLSHSGQLIFLVTADAEVGCDVQQICMGRERLLRRFFSEADRTYVKSGQDRESQARRFTEVWALKESYVKMTGEGLPLGNVGLSVTDGKAVCMTRDGRALPVRTKLWEQDGSILAVCGCERVRGIRTVCLETVIDTPS